MAPAAAAIPEPPVCSVQLRLPVPSVCRTYPFVPPVILTLLTVEFKFPKTLILAFAVMFPVVVIFLPVVMLPTTVMSIGSSMSIVPAVVIVELVTVRLLLSTVTLLTVPNPWPTLDEIVISPVPAVNKIPGP